MQANPLPPYPEKGESVSKTGEQIKIEAALKLHKAVLHAVELDMNEDADPDALIDAAVEFESVYFPITPKDRNLVRTLMREAAQKESK